MNIIRSTLIICVTLLLGTTTFTLYSYYKDRYILMKQGAGIFIFDRKEASVNYCDTKVCQFIGPSMAQMAGMGIGPMAAGYPGQPMIMAPQMGNMPAYQAPIFPHAGSLSTQPGNPFASAQMMVNQVPAAQPAIQQAPTPQPQGATPATPAAPKKAKAASSPAAAPSPAQEEEEGENAEEETEGEEEEETEVEEGEEE